MEVLDVSDPSSPTLKMTIPFPGSASDMDIHFNRVLAYVANRDGGLFILGFAHIPNLYNLRDHILGKEEIEEETHPYLDANKDFGLDISDITTIMPSGAPISSPYSTRQPACRVLSIGASEYLTRFSGLIKFTDLHEG